MEALSPNPSTTRKKKIKLSIVVHTCHPSCSGGRGRKIEVQGWSAPKHETLSEKETKAKRARIIAQVVEHLPNR
jgi:hypothetical protein